MLRNAAVLTMAGVMIGVTMSVTPISASMITDACLGSARGAAAPDLCRCIQSAADIELSRRDQRLAAKFFADPHHAQEIRQSNRARHEAFWDRYRRFGDRAEEICS